MEVPVRLLVLTLAAFGAVGTAKAAAPPIIVTAPTSTFSAALAAAIAANAANVLTMNSATAARAAQVRRQRDEEAKPRAHQPSVEAPQH